MIVYVPQSPIDTIQVEPHQIIGLSFNQRCGCIWIQLDGKSLLGDVSTGCLFASPLNPWGWSLGWEDVGNRIIILGNNLELFSFIAGTVRGGNGYTIIHISILAKWGIWTGCQIIGIIKATRQSHPRGCQCGNMEFTP